MCHAVACRTCGKATWAGCGLHVEQALAGIPHDQRCPGHDGQALPEDADWLVRLRRRR